MKMLYKKTAFMIYLFITQACAFLCVRNKNVFIAHFIEKFVFTLFRLFLIISNMLSNKCMDQYCTINTFSLRLFVTLTYYILVVPSLKKNITLMHFQLQVGFSRWDIDSMLGLHFVHVFRHSRPCCHLWRPLR